MRFYALQTYFILKNFPHAAEACGDQRGTRVVMPFRPLKTMHVLREPFILPTKANPPLVCKEEGQIMPDCRAGEMFSSIGLLSGQIRALTMIRVDSEVIHLTLMVPGYGGKIWSFLEGSQNRLWEECSEGNGFPFRDLQCCSMNGWNVPK